MKNLVLSIVMLVLCSMSAMAENKSANNTPNKELQVVEFPTRIVHGIEIDPMCGMYASDKFYQIPELGVQMIWDAKLKMLYVLQYNYYKATNISLSEKPKEQGMTITNILEVFMIGDVGRTNLCLGKIVETKEEYWISVAIYENEMYVRIYENMSDDVIFEEIFKD